MFFVKIRIYDKRALVVLELKNFDCLFNFLIQLVKKFLV